MSGLADGPLYRLPAERRFAAAYVLTGQRVRFEYAPLRGSMAPTVLHGVVLAVSWTERGQSTPMMIVKVEGDSYPSAFSLAQVGHIEPMPLHARPAVRS